MAVLVLKFVVFEMSTESLGETYKKKFVFFRNVHVSVAKLRRNGCSELRPGALAKPDRKTQNKIVFFCP